MNYQTNMIEGKYTVLKINENNFGYEVIIIKNFKKYLIYSKESLKTGDIIYLKGEIIPFKYYLTKYSFDEKKYYLSNGIYNKIKINELNKTNEINFIYIFPNLIKDDTLKVLLGISKLGENDLETFEQLNIYYLISISGIHISFFAKIIKKIMFHLNTNTKKQENIELFIYMIFLVISSYKTIIFRLFIYQLLILIKKRKEVEITNYSLMNLSFYLLIILRPYLLISKSFLISYLLITAIHLFSELIDSNDNLLKIIKINILSNIVLLPFYHKINFITIILSPIYLILIVCILFPISIINNFTNSYSLTYITNVIFKIIEGTNKINITINTYEYNYILIFFYFLVLILIIISKNNYKKIFSCFLLVILILPKYQRYLVKGLYFLDTGQGDSAVFISDESVVVIDAYLNVNSFLKGNGIKVIDYLILSHSHLDHINEANKLIKNYNVKNILTSYYDDNYNLDQTSIKVKNNYYINEKDFNIYFYGPIRDYQDPNNNSLVFKFYYNDYSVLFTGDIEGKAESDLARFYTNQLKSDFLKVAHHGSNTSSNNDFLKYVNPNSAIISLGRNNIYNFPSNDVINRLNSNNIKIYYTSVNGTVKIKRKNEVKTWY